jgi:hypothetical protein
MLSHTGGALCTDRLPCRALSSDLRLARGFIQDCTTILTGTTRACDDECVAAVLQCQAESETIFDVRSGSMRCGAGDLVAMG